VGREVNWVMGKVGQVFQVGHMGQVNHKGQVGRVSQFSHQGGAGYLGQVESGSEGYERSPVRQVRVCQMGQINHIGQVWSRQKVVSLTNLITLGGPVGHLGQVGREVKRAK
jgi:hypothetical protein